MKKYEVRSDTIGSKQQLAVKKRLSLRDEETKREDPEANSAGNISGSCRQSKGARGKETESSSSEEIGRKDRSNCQTSNQ